MTAGREVQIIRIASNGALNERNQMIICEYKTLMGRAEFLDEKVNAAIQEGFQPYGNPYTVFESGRTRAQVQAMVKYITRTQAKKEKPIITVGDVEAIRPPRA